MVCVKANASFTKMYWKFVYTSLLLEDFPTLNSECAEIKMVLLLP